MSISSLGNGSPKETTPRILGRQTSWPIEESTLAPSLTSHSVASLQIRPNILVAMPLQGLPNREMPGRTTNSEPRNQGPGTGLRSVKQDGCNNNVDCNSTRSLRDDSICTPTESTIDVYGEGAKILDLFLMKPFIQDVVDVIQLSWNIHRAQMSRFEVQKHIIKIEQEGHQAVFELYQELYPHEHKAVDSQIAKAGAGASLVSLKRTTSNLWHRDIYFRGVPGLQFVLERVTQRTGLTQAAQHPVLGTAKSTSYEDGEVSPVNPGDFPAAIGSDSLSCENARPPRSPTHKFGDQYPEVKTDNDHDRPSGAIHRMSMPNEKENANDFGAKPDVHRALDRTYHSGGGEKTEPPQRQQVARPLRHKPKMTQIVRIEALEDHCLSGESLQRSQPVREIDLDLDVTGSDQHSNLNADASHDSDEQTKKQSERLPSLSRPRCYSGGQRITAYLSGRSIAESLGVCEEYVATDEAHDQHELKGSGLSIKSLSSAASTDIARSNRPKGINLEENPTLLDQYNLRNSNAIRVSKLLNRTNEKWYELQDVKNDRYRDSMAESDTRDSTNNVRHMTSYTDNSMDESYLDVATGSALPSANDPMSELQYERDSNSDLGTNPSMIQGPIDGLPQDNRDHWPYSPAPSYSKSESAAKSNEQTAHEGISAATGGFFRDRVSLDDSSSEIGHGLDPGSDLTTESPPAAGTRLTTQERPVSTRVEAGKKTNAVNKPSNGFTNAQAIWVDSGYTSGAPPHYRGSGIRTPADIMRQRAEREARKKSESEPSRAALIMKNFGGRRSGGEPGVNQSLEYTSAGIGPPLESQNTNSITSIPQSTSRRRRQPSSQNKIRPGQPSGKDEAGRAMEGEEETDVEASAQLHYHHHRIPPWSGQQETSGSNDLATVDLDLYDRSVDASQPPQPVAISNDRADGAFHHVHWDYQKLASEAGDKLGQPRAAAPLGKGPAESDFVGELDDGEDSEEEEEDVIGEALDEEEERVVSGLLREYTTLFSNRADTAMDGLY